ncbi:Nucleotidyltransferase domain protein [uncultured archaeon]|nr:Nucleotidyltransferase domain protein [uncultured archaeon]
MENIKRILEKEPDVLFAYLFGSYAKGIQNERSDIDIAIFLREPCLLERDPLYPSRLAIKIERALAGNKTVDLRVLNDSTLRFKSQVLRYGKLLHSKDEMKRIEFETRSLAYYYDFKPFLEVYDAARKTRMGL